MLCVSAAFRSSVVALDEPEPCAQYNPKELGIDKITDDACHVAAHGVIESVSTKYTMFLPNGTPCARPAATHGAQDRVSAEPGLHSLTVPKLDGSSTDSCALAGFFRPNPNGD
jgi:hypothetical protein